MNGKNWDFIFWKITTKNDDKYKNLKSQIPKIKCQTQLKV